MTPASPLRVMADPRLELAGVVDGLGGRGPALRGPPRPGGVREVVRSFSRFKRHPAVSIQASLRRRGLDDTHLCAILSRLSPPPRLAPLYPVPDSFAARLGGASQLGRWLRALSSFARDSRFMPFFAGRRRRLEPSVAALRGWLAAKDHLGKIERYAGLRFYGSYDILLSPFHGLEANSNALVELDDGGYYIATMLSPGSGALPRPDARDKELSATLWHELGHALLDTLAELHRDRVEPSAAWHGRIPGRPYGTWLQCVKEHAVRAVMLRLLAREYGRGAAARRRAFEGRREFPFLDGMVERLLHFEAAGSADLARFYPRLLDALPPAPDAPGRRRRETGGAKDWRLEQSLGFATDGQRRRGLRYLDAILEARPDPALRLKSEALRSLLAGSRSARKAASSPASGPSASRARR